MGAKADQKSLSAVAWEMQMRRLKQDNAALKSRLNDAIRELEECQLREQTALAVDAFRERVKPIKPQERKSGLREATWVALASDWHIEETVDPSLVNGVNEYNLTIARHRARRYFEGVAWLVKYHEGRFKLRDGILALMGDLITGYLREENLEDNQCSPVQAIARLVEWISEGIRYLLKQLGFERLRVICNSGNHGRLTHKVRPSTREANSLEWLLYAMLAREFRTESRIQFVLPHGAHTYVDVYGFVLRFTHGDAAKYAGGIGGIWIPIQRAMLRWDTVRKAHITNMGHFHQYSTLNDLVVNGSLIGYNPFALEIAAKFEHPTQAMYLVDSKQGLTMPAKIWVGAKDQQEVDGE